MDAQRRLSSEAAAAGSHQADRPRSALGSGGLSGDPVLLESFLSAGLRASSTEVSAHTMPEGRPMCAWRCLVAQHHQCQSLRACKHGSEGFFSQILAADAFRLFAHMNPSDSPQQ
jgi:hypothetical protein